MHRRLIISLTIEINYHMIVIIIIMSEGGMMLQRRLQSGWGITVAAVAVALLTCLELSFEQWRLLITSGLLMTTIMLYHKKLRHFILLPSCIAFASGLLLIIMKLNHGVLV